MAVRLKDPAVRYRKVIASGDVEGRGARGRAMRRSARTFAATPMSRG